LLALDESFNSSTADIANEAGKVAVVHLVADGYRKGVYKGKSYNESPNKAMACHVLHNLVFDDRKRHGCESFLLSRMRLVMSCVWDKVCFETWHQRIEV